MKFPLSDETRQRMERDKLELQRLYSLTNAWLAAAVLVIARKAQVSTPQHQPSDCTYDSRLIWGIVPEIARRLRLGVIKMDMREIDWEIRELSNYELRVRTGYTLANIGYSLRPGWDMLSREIANGNPVVFAIDRLCPGKITDKEDPLVRRLSEIATVRAKQYEGVWTPAILM